MSMLCHLLELSPDQIAALKASPALVVDVALGAQVEQMKARLSQAIAQLPPEQREEKQVQFEAAVAGWDKATAERRSAEHAAFSDLGLVAPGLELDKSWHVLHYLLTGDIAPTGGPGDGLMTGEEVGADFSGFGPARLHEPDETTDFAGFLRTVDVEALKSRVDCQDMASNGVYGVPTGPRAAADSDAELRAEVAAYFPQLQGYVARAASNGSGLLIWLA